MSEGPVGARWAWAGARRAASETPARGDSERDESARGTCSRFGTHARQTHARAQLGQAAPAAQVRSGPPQRPMGMEALPRRRGSRGARIAETSTILGSALLAKKEPAPLGRHCSSAGATASERLPSLSSSKAV